MPTDCEVLLTVLFGNDGVLFSLLPTFLAADDVVDACLTVDVVGVAGLATSLADGLVAGLAGVNGVVAGLAGVDGVVAGLARDD